MCSFKNEIATAYIQMYTDFCGITKWKNIYVMNAFVVQKHSEYVLLFMCYIYIPHEILAIELLYLIIV